MVTPGATDLVPYRSERSGIISAPSTAVWPWLVQMGYDRGGWYAIDRLEKLLGVGRFATGTSAKQVVPELQDITVGDRIPLSKRRGLIVSTMTPPNLLELTLPPSRTLTWTWTFRLAEPTPSVTELTITTELGVSARNWLVRIGVRAAYLVFHVGHGVMERVQLRTLAGRVPAATR